MNAIFTKEFNSFFSSATGYLVIGIFLIICSLFLFVFESGYNILNSGFADLSPFFTLVPWIFIFLIPAICMKSFSEELKQGTMELLLTKPIGFRDLILGKYFGALLVVIIALIPTLIFGFTIHQLGSTPGNLDIGAIMGSYFGVILLAAAFTAIGIFSSTLSPNQIVAFLVGMFLCFITFYAFEGLAGFKLISQQQFPLEYFGISYHYKSLGRGVIDTRNLIYLLSISIFFLGLSHLVLKSRHQNS